MAAVWALSWAALGCDAVPRAEDPERVDQTWRNRIESAHRYAARKAATVQTIQPSEGEGDGAAPAGALTAAVATTGATPASLLAPGGARQPAAGQGPAPPKPPRARAKRKPRPDTHPPGRIALEVIGSPDGRGPKLIEISRTDRAPRRHAR